MTDWQQRLSEVNRPGDSKVVLANINPGTVASTYEDSVQDTLLYDRGRRIVTDDGRPARIKSLAGSGRLHQARNQVCAAFLDGHPQADLLMLIDSDMGWDPPAVEFLAETMDTTGVPILGGLCFGSRGVGIGPQRSVEQDWFPTLYSWNTVGEGAYDTRYTYPPDSLVEVGATGAAFLMVRRSVLEAIRRAEGDHWFSLIEVDGREFGEDLSFCLRARRNGFPVHVHTGVKTSHMKEVWITEAAYRDLRAPTASAVTVVVPVKDNLDMTRDLVGQLAGQGAVTDILLFDNGSTDPDMVEWLAEQTEASVFDAAEAPGISHMWNAGIVEALNRHHGLADVVFLNNDVRLGPRCVRRLIAGLRSDPTLMAACPNYDGRPGSGVTELRGICANRYDGTGGLAGFAFALRAEWIASGFRFDEDMAWWFSDNDLCLQIEQAGGRYGMVHDARCLHIDGGSQTETPDWWEERIAKDREAFEAKWPQVTLTAA